MITIKINAEDMAKVKKMLAEIPGAADRVCMRAINDGLVGMKTDASAEIRSEIVLKKSAVDATFKTIKASVTSLLGVFSSTGKPVPLIEYGARQTAKGVSVHVKQANPRSVIPGTFIAVVRSKQQMDQGIEGHKGVFWRVWHERQRKPFNRNFPYGKLPKKYRLPIVQRYGPRVPDILSNEPVMAAVLKKADDRMHANIERQINYELSKL